MAGSPVLTRAMLVRIEPRELWPWCSGSAFDAVNVEVPDRNRAVTQTTGRGSMAGYRFWKPATRVRFPPLRRRPQSSAARESTSRSRHEGCARGCRDALQATRGGFESLTVHKRAPLLAASLAYRTGTSMGGSRGESASGLDMKGLAWVVIWDQLGLQNRAARFDSSTTRAKGNAGSSPAGPCARRLIGQQRTPRAQHGRCR